MKTMLRNTALVLSVTSLAACGGGDEPAEAAPDAAIVAAPVGGMEGMEGMQMGGGMMERMQAHMQTMEGASADNLMSMMPEHRQMTANMLADMNREMRDMNMSMDGEWTETVDALRQDLVRMPEMGAPELKAFMPQHRQRVMRLMEMHSGMMADTAM